MSSFEFIINGPPVSQQARQRQGLHEWKGLVRDEAESMWDPRFGPSKASLRFAVTYYYEDIAVDMEDIVKPIMDALIGLVYNDNSQITEVSQSKQDLYSSFRIPDLSPTLAAGFGRGREILHVQIDGLESPEELMSQKIELEAAQEIAAEITAEFAPELAPEMAPEITAEFAPELAEEAAPEMAEEFAAEVAPEITPEVAEETAPESPEGQETITSAVAPPEGEQIAPVYSPPATPAIEADDLQQLEEASAGSDMSTVEIPDSVEPDQPLEDQQDRDDLFANQQALDEAQEPEAHLDEAAAPDEDEPTAAGSQEDENE